MAELFEITAMVHGKEFMKVERITRAMRLLKAYSRKHKGMKLLISGSFLFNMSYNDIDIFVISKYDKEDYREGNVHINYIPDIEKTLFFRSLYAVSVANFSSGYAIEEEFTINDILHLYEVVVLLMMQQQAYLQELRSLVLRLEYRSSKVILNTVQLKIVTDKIMGSGNPIPLISKYLIAKIISSYDKPVLIRALKMFIKKNSSPEKGQNMHENWKIYNNAYREAMDVVA